MIPIDITSDEIKLNLRSTKLFYLNSRCKLMDNFFLVMAITAEDA